jgi:hypothetical protein
MRADIKSILEAAIAAPSVQNCQPWQWHVEGKVLTLKKVRERDCLSVDYAVNEMQAVAFGAAIENVVVAASEFGYRTDVAYLPENTDAIIAKLSLERDAEVRPDPLAAYIYKRITNRKAYFRTPLAADEEHALKAEGGENVLLISDRAVVEEIAALAARFEQQLSQNQSAHYFLYSHINWNEEQEQRRRSGYHIDSLELGFERGLFALMHRWERVRLANAFGLSRFIHFVMKRRYAATPVFGLISARGHTLSDYLEAGRRAERVWLRATALGLSVHPLLGVIGSAIAIRTNNVPGFSPRSSKKILHAEKNLRSHFNIEHELPIAFLFRLGHAEGPSYRSSRFSFETIVKGERSD